MIWERPCNEIRFYQRLCSYSNYLCTSTTLYAINQCVFIQALSCSQYIIRALACINSLIYCIQGCVHTQITRIHSSRMRTGRSLTVCRSLLLGGEGGSPSGGGLLLGGPSFFGGPPSWGVSFWGPPSGGASFFGGVSFWGVSFQGRGASFLGGLLLGGLLLGGVSFLGGSPSGGPPSFLGVPLSGGGCLLPGDPPCGQNHRHE